MLERHAEFALVPDADMTVQAHEAMVLENLLAKSALYVVRDSGDGNLCSIRALLYEVGVSPTDLHREANAVHAALKGRDDALGKAVKEGKGIYSDREILQPLLEHIFGDDAPQLVIVRADPSGPPILVEPLRAHDAPTFTASDVQDDAIVIVESPGHFEVVHNDSGRPLASVLARLLSPETAAIADAPVATTHVDDEAIITAYLDACGNNTLTPEMNADTLRRFAQELRAQGQTTLVELKARLKQQKTPARLAPEVIEFRSAPTTSEADRKRINGAVDALVKGGRRRVHPDDDKLIKAYLKACNFSRTAGTLATPLRELACWLREDPARPTLGELREQLRLHGGKALLNLHVKAFREANGPQARASMKIGAALDAFAATSLTEFLEATEVLPQTPADAPAIGQTPAGAPHGLPGAQAVGLAAVQAAPSTSAAAQASSQIEDGQPRTPLLPFEWTAIETILALKPPQARSVEAAAGGGCRWEWWPIQSTNGTGPQGEARLLVDASGVRHRLVLSRTSDAGDRIRTEVHFGRRPSNAQWLAKAALVRPKPGSKRSPIEMAPQFVRFLEGPGGHLPVESLQHVTKRPLVDLLTSMAERGVPLQDAFSSVLPPHIPATVATLSNLSREQLFDVAEALQDADGTLALDLSDLRHLPGNVSGQVVEAARESKQAGRELMALVQCQSEPMGDTAWGQSYCGGRRTQEGYIHRYGLSVFLMQRFAAENDSYAELVGAATAMRTLEDRLACSEPLQWSVIENLSTLGTGAITRQFTLKAIPFVRFLEANKSTLRAQYENPPTTAAGRRQRKALLKAKPVASPKPLNPSPVTAQESSLRDQAEAYRGQLNATLMLDPSRESDLYNKLRQFSRIMDRIATPWTSDAGREHGETRAYQDERNEAFTAQVFAQHDAAIARGDLSQCLHHFLELPRAAQQRLVEEWFVGMEISIGRTSLNDRFELGLTSDDVNRTYAASHLQIDRDMLAKVPMNGMKETQIQARGLIQAGHAIRPADESILMQMADPTLLQFLSHERKTRQEATGTPVSRSAELSNEAMQDLADRHGLVKSLSKLGPDLRKLEKAWHNEPYDPRWQDDPTRPADADAPRRPRIARHVELAEAVLKKVKAGLPPTDQSTGALIAYVDARDAVVEWLNFVESKMHNTSFHAVLRLDIARPSIEAFLERVAADLRAAAYAVETRPAPALLGYPVYTASEQAKRIDGIRERRAQFIRRTRYLADQLTDRKESAVRSAFSTLHGIALSTSAPPVAGASEAATATAGPDDESNEQTNEAWVGRSIYGAMLEDDDPDIEPLSWVAG